MNGTTHSNDDDRPVAGMTLYLHTLDHIVVDADDGPEVYDRAASHGVPSVWICTQGGDAEGHGFTDMTLSIRLNKFAATGYRVHAYYGVQERHAMDCLDRAWYENIPVEFAL